MKIAQISPLYEAVPPRLYGGTERVVAHLADALPPRSAAHAPVELPGLLAAQALERSGGRALAAGEVHSCPLEG